MPARKPRVPPTIVPVLFGAGGEELIDEGVDVGVDVEVDVGIGVVCGFFCSFINSSAFNPATPLLPSDAPTAHTISLSRLCANPETPLGNTLRSGSTFRPGVQMYTSPCSFLPSSTEFGISGERAIK